LLDDNRRRLFKETVSSSAEELDDKMGQASVSPDEAADDCSNAAEWKSDLRTGLLIAGWLKKLLKVLC